MWLPFSNIQWDWRLTHRSLKNAWNLDFSKFSVSVQWTFGNASVDWKENIHPVQQIKNGDSLKRIKNKLTPFTKSKVQLDCSVRVQDSHLWKNSVLVWVNTRFKEKTIREIKTCVFYLSIVSVTLVSLNTILI